MKFYLVIEPFADLYRCLIRIPIWIIYLTSLPRDSAVLIFIVYIPIKAHNLYFFCVNINDCLKSSVISFQVTCYSVYTEVSRNMCVYYMCSYYFYYF